MNDIVYVTEEGLAKLKAELEDRTEVRRHEIAARLDDAIKMGDLKENADYHAAKEDQAFNEGRVTELQNAVRNAEIISKEASTGVIRIGNTVTIAEDGDEDDAEVYQIVGAREADPMKGMISNESPIGKALLGKVVGDTISAEIPSGTISFKVLKIE